MAADGRRDGRQDGDGLNGGAAGQVTLADLLRPELVVRLKVATKAALLSDLARRMAPVAGLAAGEILAALEKRETLGSTGVGGGIAIPHARLKRLGAMCGCFVRLERAIDFAAVDGAPVDLAFLLLVPEDAASQHLAMLAAISRRLRDRATQLRLRAASSPAELHAVLTG